MCDRRHRGEQKGPFTCYSVFTFSEIPIVSVIETQRQRRRFMNKSKTRTVLLGFVFLAFLVLAYVENTSFFVYVQKSFTNPPLAVLFVFVHNVLAISLIILAMAFYVELVLNFMPKRKIEHVVLENPRVFAIVFTVMILVLSILRASTLLRGQIEVSALPVILLMILPWGIAEGYGIFQAIHKTLRRSLSMHDLAIIYFIFFAAAVIEVGFVQALFWISTK